MVKTHDVVDGRNTRLRRVLKKALELRLATVCQL
jgi:hypothetical protein